MGMNPNASVTKSILKNPNAATSQAGGSNSNTASIWKKVCFDDVHIREYPFILGDNPAVSKGAPLQIDWNYYNEDVIDVDIFEHCREPVRRHRKKIVLSARKRAKILLSAGHTVEEIADMTLLCLNVKKQRVESIKSSGQWDFNNVNLADFMSGTAEVTGRTLKLVGFDVMGKAGMELAKGTGKIVMATGTLAGDAVLGTGRLVVGTGKVATDAVVETGKFVVKGTTDVVKGTGQLVVGSTKAVVQGTTDVVLGTGHIMRRGTETVVFGTGNAILGTGNVIMGTGNVILKGTGKAARRITNIFSQGDLIRGSDLKEGKEHLRHVETNSTTSPNRSPKARSSSRPRRNTDMPRQSSKRGVGSSLSPKRSTSDATAARPSNLVPMLFSEEDEDDIMDELQEMEEFMLHLQGMDPEQIKRVLSAT